MIQQSIYNGLVAATALVLINSAIATEVNLAEKAAVSVFKVMSGEQIIEIQSNGFRFRITDKNCEVIAPAHSDCGLKLGGSAVARVVPGDAENRFVVTAANGLTAEVAIALENGAVAVTVSPKSGEVSEVALSLGGMPVAYGLGDSGGWSGSLNLVKSAKKRYGLVNNAGSQRWQSSFVVFPQNRLAGVVLEGRSPSVTLGPDQYTMAVDRTNERVAAIASPFHPSVIRLINMTIEIAHAQGKWVGLCGEFAANPLAAPLLLGLGLDEFSMAPIAIPEIKALLRQFSLEECKEIAGKVLQLPKSGAVQAYLTSVVSAKTE